MATIDHGELARKTLGVLFIVLLLATSVWILRPFLPSLVWAAMIVVATWPFMIRVQGWCGGRRGLAVLVMTLLMVLIFLLPLSFAISALVERAGDATAWINSLSEKTLPDPPAFVGGIPIVGKRLVAMWLDLKSRGMPEITSRIQPYAGDLSRWVLDQAGTFGLLIVQLLLVVILSAVLYAGGEAWGNWVRDFGRRIAGERGGQSVVLAGQAIRGVALGIVVTALLQSGLGGIGLLLAGIPFPLLLTAVMFVLCIAQIGPMLVLIPATAWLFINNETVWGSVMVVWSIVVGLMDNVVRPVLIKRGADLPLLLVISGVVGGLLAFGLIGLFIGPVVLAVTYTLTDAWIGHDGSGAAAGRSPPPT